MAESAVAEPSALLERADELERLHVAISDVGRQAGHALVIEGPAGIGKSRLLGATRVSAESLGIRVLNARASELEQTFPFGVVRQLFERPLFEADAEARRRWLTGAGALAGEVLATARVGGEEAPAHDDTTDDPGYAWQHGLYWLASNISLDAPLVLMVDDLQWCDAPSARALAFIARRLDGQPLGVICATRPLDPARSPELATMSADAATQVLRPSALTLQAIRDLITWRFSREPDEQFVRTCFEVAGGNPFLAGELLNEVAERGLPPVATSAAEVGEIVPRGVANAVLLRLARLPHPVAELARALSALGDGAQMGDAAQLAGLEGAQLESSIAALLAAGIVDSGTPIRFSHPILRAAIYHDLSPAERERLHQGAVAVLRARDAPVDQVAAQVMRTEPAAEPARVALLREAARAAIALGDAAGAAALLARALEEPPGESERADLLLELGQAHARAGAAAAIEPLSEIVEQDEDSGRIVAAAIELSGMLFFSGRAAQGASVLRHAGERLAPDTQARERLEVALLGLSSTSASARREAQATIAELKDPGGPACDVLQATTLATLAMEQVLFVRSAATTIDLAERAIAAGLPLEPHRGENWVNLAIAALGVADALEAALQSAEEILTHARTRGAAMTVMTISSLRALIALRCGDLPGAHEDAHAAIALAPELFGARFLVLAVSAAVLAGLERDESPEALRGLIDRTGVEFDPDFTSSSQLRYASGLLRAAGGNHQGAIEELEACGREEPAFGGENPAMIPWRSAAALSLAELGRDDDARELAAEELRRAESFGASRAIGIALRAQACVGPRARLLEGLSQARSVLEASPARLEHARVMVDLGASLRAAGQRTAAREPLLEGLALAARCGARTLERRARAELSAIGVRPRSTDRSGTDSLTPSERRVVDLAAAGGTNREIAQTLFVTEKTVETHLGRAFRKLDVTSRRALPEVLARAESARA